MKHEFIQQMKHKKNEETLMIFPSFHKLKFKLETFWGRTKITSALKDI
jgi:hypothetical protein